MTCGTCAHAKPATADKMPGWLNCAWAEKWHYRSPSSACSFSPVRWQQKKESAK